MAAGPLQVQGQNQPFQDHSPGWQFQKISDRFWEWLELLIPKRIPPTPGSAPSFAWLQEWLKVSFWLIVIGLVLWAAWQLYQWLAPQLKAQYQAAARQRDRSSTAPPDRSIGDWVQLAQQYRRQGNYGEACRALYLAMLQRLNDAKLVPHQKSRTDGEYWNMVQRLPQSQAYRTLLRTHEQLCFGTASAVSAEVFERCQQAYGEIEREIEAHEQVKRAKAN